MRSVLAVIAGFVAWWIVASIVSLGLRAAWPTYAAAEPEMHFTLAMLFARLLMGAFSTIVAGLVTARIARPSRRANLALGAVLLLFFVPVHIQLLDAFPLWYHAFFLGSLVPLALLPAGWPRMATIAASRPAAPDD